MTRSVGIFQFLTVLRCLPEYGEQNWQTLVCKVGRVVLCPVFTKVLEKFVDD